jgi:hypothetical protein
MPTRPLRALLAAVSVLALLATAAACGDDDGGESGSPEAFCAQIQDATSEVSFSAADPDYDFDVVLETFRSATPPDEIEADWNLIRGALEAMSEIDFDDPESLEQLDDDPVDFEELDAASQRIEAYVLEECGVDLGFQ